MDDVLAKICADTAIEVGKRKLRVPVEALRAKAEKLPPPRGFANALRATKTRGAVPLIAEIKKASPSKGLIRPDFDPPKLARSYRDGGATCLSVLTDKPYFQGEDAYLVAARDAVPLPALRKDFMLGEYQIEESRALGADCILLILACLDDCTVQDLCELALTRGMDVLAEVHDEAEMARALKLPATGPGGTVTMLGVNNRNLKTLKVDLANFERLAPMAPKDRLLVAESGIKTRDDIDRLTKAGAGAFLVGESLMLQDDVTAATKALIAQGPNK
jgi:indole-3-glycerol phosphate synthase